MRVFLSDLFNFCIYRIADCKTVKWEQGIASGRLVDAIGQDYGYAIGQDSHERKHTNMNDKYIMIAMEIVLPP